MLNALERRRITLRLDSEKPLREQVLAEASRRTRRWVYASARRMAERPLDARHRIAQGWARAVGSVCRAWMAEQAPEAGWARALEALARATPRGARAQIATRRLGALARVDAPVWATFATAWGWMRALGIYETAPEALGEPPGTWAADAANGRARRARLPRRTAAREIERATAGWPFPDHIPPLTALMALAPEHGPHGGAEWAGAYRAERLRYEDSIAWAAQAHGARAASEKVRESVCEEGPWAARVAGEMARERWGREALAQAWRGWREEPALHDEAVAPRGPTLGMEEEGHMYWEFRFDRPDVVIAAGAGHPQVKTWAIAADYTAARIAIEGERSRQPVRMRTHQVRTRRSCPRIEAMERVLRESAPRWDR